MLNHILDVLSSFERNEVKYVVIGGIAAVLHGVPRATFGLDILIESTEDNASRLLKALCDAGLATSLLISPQQILKNEITVFEDKVRIDVQTTTPGLEFQQSWDSRQVVEYKGQKLNLVSRENLIQSKRSSGRPIDLEDVRLLEEKQNG